MASTYVTQDGDNLSSIAQKFYGDGNQWPTIHQANLGLIGNDPNVLMSGWTLTIPDLVPSQTYVTVAGDSLWSIAQHFYGDGTQWTKIYNANQALIGPDSNVLMAGWTLTIPA